MSLGQRPHYRTNREGDVVELLQLNLGLNPEKSKLQLLILACKLSKHSEKSYFFMYLQ